MPRTPSRSKSQRSSEGTATIDKRSPRTGFLDLPAELRNDIYRMCLGTSQILDICNIPHHEYREKVESGSRPLRSAYATPDLTKNVGSRGYGMPGRMLPSRDEITTYVVDGAGSVSESGCHRLAGNQPPSPARSCIYLVWRERHLFHHCELDRAFPQRSYARNTPLYY